MERIRVIAFDYYGTLEDVHTDEARRSAWLTVSHLMRYHGAAYTPSALRTQFDRLWRADARQLAAAHAGGTAPAGMKPFQPEADVLRVLRALYARCGVAADDTLLRFTAETLRAACTDYFRLYPGTREMLAALRAAGKRIALLSNAQAAYTLPEMDAVGVTGCFDRVFISSENGAQKPCAAFYQQLIDWAGVAPGEIMMVGNSPADDILPAAAMGLRTCYVHSALTTKGAPVPPCDLYLPRPDMPRLTKMLLHAVLPAGK